MTRPRKHHVQTELPRFDKNGQRRGGKRKGAGRPKKGLRASERHERRPALKRHEPVHVVNRTAPEVGVLRRREIYRAIRAALVTTFKKDSFRVVHLSIQGTHVHLLVEANDRLALAAGMQAFQISAARKINAAISVRRKKRRKGNVFVDRYHARIIRTPRQARCALAYVLNNWRKHREDRDGIAREWVIDPFSSAVSFRGWRDVDPDDLVWPIHYEPLPVWDARTWLLAEGWKKHGLIATTEIPSERVKPAVAVVIAE